MQQDIEHCKQMVYATAATEVGIHETRAFVVWASHHIMTLPKLQQISI